MKLFRIAVAALLANSAFAADEIGTVRLVNVQAEPGDMFGECVAVAGDYLCVGAPARDTGASQNTGSVFVYDRATLAFITRIDDPGATAQGRFGADIVACGPGRVAIAAQFGRRVSIHALPSGALITQVADPPPQSGGFAFALECDGTSLLVADLFEEIGNSTGAVQVFDAGTGLFQRSIPNPNVTPASSSFPFSMLLDGATLYAASTYSKHNPTNGSGEAHAIDFASGATLAFYPDVTNGQNLLGGAIGKIGNRVAVAPSYDDGFPYGYMYLYEGTNSTPVLTVRSPGLANSSVNDQFGASLATWRGELLAAAPRGPYEVATRPGVIYRYDGASDTIQGRLLPNPTDTATLRFGSDMATDGDKLYVGAGSYDFSGAAHGVVYVFEVGAAAAGSNWNAY